MCTLEICKRQTIGGRAGSRRKQKKRNGQANGEEEETEDVAGGKIVL